MSASLAVRNHVRRHRRAIDGLTQEGLAERVGVTRQTIISIERGSYNPSVGLALLLGKALGAPVEELFEIWPEEHHG